MKNIIKHLFVLNYPKLFNYLLLLASFLPIFLPKPISAQFGKIDPPVGVSSYQAKVGADEIGIIAFASNLVRLITIVAGIWMMINFITAGWIYLTGEGDSSAGEKVSKKILNSVMGMAIIAFSYTIAAIIGLLIFGDASYIIQPTLESAI